MKETEKMSVEKYVNCRTGEETQAQRAAVDWNRAGDRVFLYAGGGVRAIWDFDGTLYFIQRG